MYVEHNKPNWDKLQAISVLTSDSPKLGPALKKNPYIYYTCMPHDADFEHTTGQAWNWHAFHPKVHHNESEWCILLQNLYGEFVSAQHTHEDSMDITINE